MYSEYIYKLISFIENEYKLKVNIVYELDNNLSGWCDYINSSIFVTVLDSKNALMTIAHETGHYISYLLYGIKHNIKQSNFSVEYREKLAYIFGYYILKKINGNNVISKNEWNEFHEYH